ncbi:MAG: glycosyltransferase [Propionibacteriaceae bacterium]|nr:glycosyltransferase [Propionibacteriaceae bacterium]
MLEPFSVLLPVYAGDVPAHFERSVRSVTADQALRPDELVIVVDGPVPAGISAVLARAESGTLCAGVGVRVVSLPDNVGLARALDAGLAACTHEVVARADADDISLPHRFARQVPLLAEGYDLLSSTIVEFEHDERRWGLRRAWPSDPDALARIARLADPFNHPSVVYRRGAVAAAGGYEHLARLEDYWLFIRMLDQGARVTNVAEPLVLYRIGAGAYRRRGGWELFRSELTLQARMLGMGFTTPWQYLRNLVVRGLWRFAPPFLRRPGYAAFTRWRGDDDTR